MAAKKITVVISQSQGKNPAMRQLEEELAARCLMEPGVDVSIVPNLYDMQADHTGLLFLRSVNGPLVVLGWLYPRGIRWILDRQGVKGREGVTLLVADDDDEEEEVAPEEHPDAVGAADVPPRNLYCIDLRVSKKADAFLEEIRRIAAENSQQTVDLMSWIGGNPEPAQLERYLSGGPAGESALPAIPINGNGNGNGAAPHETENGELPVIDEPVKRRWYPVIDYSRCTNCMECIDFCLFGVYGVDNVDRILVESQDNCKKGCPACSRVCPENAIIFPQHKSPAIAGADGEVAGLKIDLSKLFGGDGKTGIELAVAERDNELVNDGREAVGMAVGIPKRQSEKSDKPRDDLDDLLDGLDDLDG
ncbi:MAG: ferredoxin family protein [Planctomycetota bacterium]|nr:MAG: ferredoxin family protein [Planctomycetota bacterium]REJ89768.1 MAG: ferredoxin family protein [Planctomycetota bacterium]REK21592.1 MAG: ferredoxin family protein [Planctomycetota bacterium]REK39855.1 MAG: ferredoxin family protein [Planctomycetota bacterium]